MAIYRKDIKKTLNHVFGIDLGTNNVKIYNRADDTILVEKNMIAIENKNNVFAYGDSAFSTTMIFFAFTLASRIRS